MRIDERFLYRFMQATVSLIHITTSSLLKQKTNNLSRCLSMINVNAFFYGAFLFVQIQHYYA